MAASDQDDTPAQGALTHLGPKGHARMVDVSEKNVSQRIAVAEGRIRMSPETLAAVEAGDVKKGDVLQVARVAAISAGKRTGDLIPLCHVLPGASFSIDVATDPTLPGVVVRAEVKVAGQTGVEMEALMAVTVGLLTVYDMAKSLDRGMVIEDVRLLLKDGGKSGRWSADG